MFSKSTLRLLWAFGVKGTNSVWIGDNGSSEAWDVAREIPY